MPPTGTLLSPTGLPVVNNTAEQLARIAEIRAEALALQITNDEDRMDRDTCLRYLAETEATLKEATLKGETR